MGRIAALAERARVGRRAARSARRPTCSSWPRRREELERERTRVGRLRDGAARRGAEAETLVAGPRPRSRRGRSPRAEGARARADALAREADVLQSERDSLAGRLASLEEMVATHSAFDEGVRALLAQPGGIEVLGVVADCLETDSVSRARGRGVPGRPPAGRPRPRRRRMPCAGSATSRSPAPAAAPSCPSPPPAPGRTAAPCATIARRGAQGQGACCPTSTASPGPHADRIRASLPDALVVETLEDALRIVGAPRARGLRHARRRDAARLHGRGRARA